MSGNVSCGGRPLGILELVQTPRGPPSSMFACRPRSLRVPRLAVPCSSSGSAGSLASRPQCRLHLQSKFRSACPFPPMPSLSTRRSKFAQRICTAEEIRKPTGAYSWNISKAPPDNRQLCRNEHETRAVVRCCARRAGGLASYVARGTSFVCVRVYVLIVVLLSCFV